VLYNISGALDWQGKTFHGRMTLAWRDTGSAPSQNVPLRLRLNEIDPADAPDAPGVQGRCQIKSVRSGGRELAYEMVEGEAVCLVRLPGAVGPRGNIAIDVEWEAAFPRMRRGCGWADGFLVASDWYPRLDIHGDGHFGDYDVEMSLPNALQLANTGTVLVPLDKSGRLVRDALGREVEAVQDPARRLNFIYKIRAEGVRDFSWIATPNGNWGLSRLDWGDTQVYIYCAPENGSQRRRLREAVKSALGYAERRLAPYPYPVLSVVDLPAGVLEGGGDQAPMLAAVSNIAFDPYNQRFVPERAAIRQIGEQLFRWAAAPGGPSGPSAHRLWEGLSEWFTDKVMDGDYPWIFKSRRFAMDSGFRRWQASGLPFFPLRAPDALGREAPDALSQAAPGLFSRLEALIGEDAMEGAARLYLTGRPFQDLGGFRAAAERASGADLGAFWANYVERVGELDYRIRAVATAPDGRGAVTLERACDVIAPVTLRVVMKDGREALVEWDGREGSAVFHFDGPVAEAALDPEGRHPALKGRLRSTWAAAPVRRGLLSWASLVSGALCGLLQGAGLG
jgi:hypothetical protein